MARPSSQPFNVQDTGRMGFRREWEPTDDHPLLVEDSCQCKGCREHEGFWRDQTERMMYEDAVEANPKRADEGPFSYIRRISEIVTGQYAKLGLQMPRARMSRRERDQQLAKLRAQARPDLPSGVEDYA